MKIILFDVHEEISELNAKHQLLLDKQSMLMEKIDQLNNPNTRPSQAPLPLTSPLKEQSVPSDIPALGKTYRTFRWGSVASICGIIQETVLQRD